MLKNEIHEPTWFFDLEWVPDAAGAMRLYDLPPETTEREAMERLWRETPGYCEENPCPFVKYLFSRVVSIAFLSRRIVFKDGERHIEFGLHSLPKLPLDAAVSDEAEIIGQFLHYVGVRSPQLVGYNSMEADLQVLIQRGLINEVRAESFSDRPNKPWEGRDYFDKFGESHLDLMKKFSSGAMTPRLNDLARLCGFPGKMDVDGKQVAELWLAGELKQIVEYNQIDTLNTYLVWLRVVNFSGKLSEEEYITEQDDFRSFLDAEAAKEENDHLRRFIDKWDAD
ncbi:MAG: ribonuclease H-like domain-containing protein [Pyrinomonadaceae bacterium]